MGGTGACWVVGSGNAEDGGWDSSPGLELGSSGPRGPRNSFSKENTVDSCLLPDLPRPFKSALQGAVCPDLHPPGELRGPGTLFRFPWGGGVAEPAPHFCHPLQGSRQRKSLSPHLDQSRAALGFPHGSASQTPERTVVPEAQGHLHTSGCHGQFS